MNIRLDKAKQIYRPSLLVKLFVSILTLFCHTTWLTQSDRRRATCSNM